ncbi:regulator of g-protein signaling 4 [Anaeramoeba flamelloides]|uniref:Regulator of g-protein signaling 4 n=1 Tax=Anaeramoeba flamelloides TaxID=1746091 RepID=A0ABQ8Y0G6_9EUKA|nr:regulator of g-protein signaling 4 [Anaeramoeba flamelloides]
MFTGQKSTILGLKSTLPVPRFSRGSESPNKMEECIPQKILQPIKPNKIFYQNERIFFEKFNKKKRKSNEYSPRKRQLVSRCIISDEENHPDTQNLVSPNKLRRTSITKRNNSKKRNALRQRYHILQDINTTKNSKKEVEKYVRQMNLTNKFGENEKHVKKKRKTKKKKKSKMEQLIFELQQEENYKEEENKAKKQTEETLQEKENSSHSTKRIFGRIRTMNNSNNLLSGFKKKKHRKIHRNKQKKTKTKNKRRYFKTFDKKNTKLRRSKNLKAQKNKLNFNLQTLKEIKIPKTRQEKEKIQKEISKYFLTFKDVLGSEVGLYYFHKFLKSQYCSENLKFYQAVNRYKQIEDPKKRSRKAFKIFNTFVKTSSKHEINIQYENRFEIQENIKKEHFPPSLYNGAQKQIYHLMSNDSFLHFFNHPISIYMLNELKSHN